MQVTVATTKAESEWLVVATQGMELLSQIPGKRVAFL